MLLEPEEKERFIRYLTVNMESSKMMYKQFLQMKGPAMEELAKREHTKMLGYAVVLQDLTSGESVSIGKDEVGE